VIFLRRKSIFTFPPGIVSKQVFSLQKCGQLVMMRSGHNSSGRNMDEGRLGTPAQRPIAIGSINGIYQLNQLRLTNYFIIIFIIHIT
jgi:hypothetical protein